MEADCNIDEVVLVKVRLSLSPGSLYFQSLNVLLESVDEMAEDSHIDKGVLVKVMKSSHTYRGFDKCCRN